MVETDALQAYADLVEVRRKAARRNGVFVGIVYLVIVAIAGYMLKLKYSVDLNIIVYAFLALNFTLLTSQQMSSEIANKGILDLIAAILRAQSDSA